jgi:alkyl hydroperoxide reductase subunit AhpC
MLGIGDRLPNFAAIGVKPGFNEIEENGETAFETLNETSFPGKWKIIFFYPKDFTFVCPTETPASPPCRRISLSAAPSFSAARRTMNT